MSASPEAQARTRNFARVLGPFMTIVPATVAIRADELGRMSLEGFFGNPVLVWVLGGMLLFAGLFIIAFHQYWSSAAAVIISLLGWFFALRGLVLLVAPSVYERAMPTAMGTMLLVRAGFFLIALAGLWLTYVGWIRPR
jgi:hypothetical protein